jgi:ketosteroid isomerase-like protein
MSPVKMERVEEALRLALAFAEAFNRHDVTAIGALLSEACVFESAGPAPAGVRYEGRTATTRAIAGFFEQAPELRMEVEDAYGLGRRSVLRWSLSGLAAGHERRRGVDLFTVRNGRIEEILAYAKG